MSTYNTGNPIPSTDVRDLYDNAENFDTALNTQASRSWTDRLGVVRKSWWGMEQDFQDFLLASGYQDLGEYAAGMEITARNQIFSKDGEFYRAGPSLVLPYTTTGDWETEGDNFVSMGDAVLRQNLAAPDGSSLVGFQQSGAGAIARTIQERDRETVLLSDFGGKPSALAATNDAAFVAALAELAARGGGTLYVSLPGVHNISATITSAANNIHLKLGHATTIQYPTTVNTAVFLSGARCSITGGHGGGFLGPEVWDGTNVAPTYGVLRFGGQGAYANTRLFNIKKVGIWLKDVSDCTVEGCQIIANYPQAQWTGVETVNYGIGADPDAAPSGGNFIVQGNTIKSCVQGIHIGNYGTGEGFARGINIVGNIFEGCWNHGIYSNYTMGMTAEGNTFNRCQLPVVASGQFNIVNDNTMYTAVNSGTDERDVVGISLRDPSFCVVKGNTLRGTTTPAAAVVINLQYFANIPGQSLTGNIVEGNTIGIWGTNRCTAIRIIGESSFGTTTVTNNTIANNNITGPAAVDGLIVMAGITTGSNHGNKIIDNTLRVTNGQVGVHCIRTTMGLVRGNTVDWAYDSPTPGTTVMSVALSDTTRTRVTENATIVSFNFGTNLAPVGVREVGTSNNNSSHNNIDQVDLTKSGVYTPITSLNGSLLDVQETGAGAPTIAARIGSTWRRFPFGSPGATFYVKESGTDGSGWTAK